ncbi:hypothetical protein P175DRAFT_0533943 [Aspergillus ochraceoroseus IBT 24754]|uniref:Uncharacterized protein n=1 Tax=Aspergillus ochraceoroseus IBT 24754 TaxID=1392256 RepID=A0A2T5LT96_9EURO|nr:uncharacterized protein P175DRAFT_0533943 [Aspergillus ochraceoroseus IBT 24754]PTU19506.1 hypothetical protein P175DRAFT_0533943 [Aspergillus ochraceoroseus IBT 24754]
MNYHNYPIPLTYPPPHILPTRSSLDSRVAPSPAVAVASAAPLPQPPGLLPPSSSSYHISGPVSASSPRAYHDPFQRSEPEMPQSAPSQGTYHYQALQNTPDSTLYPDGNTYASLRREDNGYHVSQANHGSRKQARQSGGSQKGNHKVNHNHFNKALYPAVWAAELPSTTVSGPVLPPEFRRTQTLGPGSSGQSAAAPSDS